MTGARGDDQSFKMDEGSIDALVADLWTLRDEG
jgi:hypothetical protein